MFTRRRRRQSLKLALAFVSSLVLLISLARPAQAFSVSIHESITSDALPFIKPDVLDDINDEHAGQDYGHLFDSALHFDSCRFKEASEEINENYDDTLIQADPSDFDEGDAPDQFGQVLHAAQDFYAHSNWVDLGQTTLVEHAGTAWDPLLPYTVHDGVMLVQGENEQPFGPGSLSRNGRIVTVNAPGGSFKGVISGYYGTDDDCADNIAMSHGDLNKDEPNLPNHTAARALAQAQTEHEFYRLVQLVFDHYGAAGVTTLLDKWVKTDATSQAQLKSLLARHDVFRPTITCPPAITVEADSPAGAIGPNLGTPTASDVIVANITGTPIVSNNAQSILPLGTNTVKWTATDGSALPGMSFNTASCNQQVTVVDTTPPTTSASRTPANPNGQNGWYTTDVKVCLSAYDKISSATTFYRINGGAQQTYRGCFSVTSESQDIVVTFYSVDAANNAETAQTLSIKIDKTKPTISGAADPKPNAAGWNNTDVTVTFTCADARSGIAACTPPTTLTNNGIGQSVSGTAQDKAGHTQQATVGGINIDKTPPGGDCKVDPNVHWLADGKMFPVRAIVLVGDALSGPNGFVLQSITINEDVNVADNIAGWDFGTPDTEGELRGAYNPSGNPRIYTLTYRRFDKAGNINDCALTVTVPVDKTLPTISGAAAPAPNAAGWNNTDVTVTFNCADAVPGIESCTQPVTLTSDGPEQHVDGTARDLAGNTTTVTVKHINIDKTPPVVSCAVTPNILQPADGKFVPVVATVDVSDGLSGANGFTLVSVEGNEDGSAFGIQDFKIGTADTDGLLRAEHSPFGNGRIYTLTYRGADKAGNTATCSATVSVPNDQAETQSSAGEREPAAAFAPGAFSGAALPPSSDSRSTRVWLARDRRAADLKGLAFAHGHSNWLRSR